MNHHARARALALALSVTACAHAPAVVVKPLTTQVFAPATASVAAYESFPDRKHVRLAEMSVERGANAVDLLKEKARLLGADAIVVTAIEDSDEDRLASVRDAANPSGAVRTLHHRAMVHATAIRFEKP